MSGEGSGTPDIRESLLYQDLHRDHRDAMYRAMTFAARRGGPPLPGDTREALTAHRQRAQTWLLTREDPEDLLLAYERFVLTWSPIFAE